MSKTSFQLLIIFLASVLVCFANIWGYPLYILDEVKNAQCAREMWEAGNFIVPVFNGELRTDKPPLHYFFMMMSYELFGFSPFSARFFSALFGVLTVCMTYLVTRIHINERAAAITAVSLLAALGLTAQFHLATPDPFLVFFFSGALYAYYHFFVTRKGAYLSLAYVSAGLAVLTKGPVAIILLLISLLIFLLAKKKLNKRSILGLKLWLGCIIILGINLPWYTAVHILTDGAWTEGFFFQHNLNRFTTNEVGHEKAFYVPLLFLIAWALPFSVFLLQSMYKPFKYRLNDLAILSLVTTVTVVVFFSFSTNKLIHYVSPALPFLAIMVGNFLFSVNSANWKSSKMDWSLFFLILLMAGIPVGLYLSITRTKIINDMAAYAAVGTPLLLGAIGVVFFMLKKSLKGVVVTMATSFLFFINLTLYLFLPAVLARTPVVTAYPLIRNAETGGIASFKKFNAAFVPLISETIKSLETPEELEHFFDTYPEGVVISRSRYIKHYELDKKYRIMLLMNDVIDERETIILKRK